MTVESSVILRNSQTWSEETTRIEYKEASGPIEAEVTNKSESFTHRALINYKLQLAC